ncbi:hypothetical protein ACFE04_015834 [Oxalis oulophora]
MASNTNNLAVRKRLAAGDAVVVGGSNQLMVPATMLVLFKLSTYLILLRSSPATRKSRWADDEPKPVIDLPGFVKEFTAIEFDPEIRVLNARLLEINRILQSDQAMDDRPEG